MIRSSGTGLATVFPATLPALLAHQGGWDEILLIAGPILLIAGLLLLAKRRVDAAAADRGVGDGADRHAGQDTGGD